MSEDQHSQLTTQNCQLLVVDDEENVLKAIRRQLHKKFKVYIATSAEAGLKILRENRIDIVLSDQRMPDTNGAEFLAQVRQEFPNIVRLMLTGYADINAVISAINEGGVEQYIQKPWDANQLEHIITETYELQMLKTAKERLASNLALALKAEKHFNQLQSDFIMLVSHEFRTPLSVITSSAQTLRAYRTRLEAERIDLKLDRIINQVQHMTYLLEEVAAIGSHEQGMHLFQAEAIDICDHFQASIDSVKASLASKHNLVTEIPEHCPRFVGDADIIRKIVTELLTNALKFSTGNGTIFCKLLVHPTQAEITISDEGMGIPEKDLDRIFKPFVKGKNAENIQGIGLGLAIVRHAVNLHQGQIFVESNNQQGTTIRVILPSLSDFIDQQDTWENEIKSK
jgi:two-component system sensor histidine kinase/response regulator